MFTKTDKGRTINKVVMLKIDKLSPNPDQPRLEFSREEIEGLAQSILENGLLQPLTVRRAENGGYTLISGERRLRALISLDAKEAPCIVLETSQRQAALFGLIENLQREDLNPFEEALAMKRLMSEWDISQQELGQRLGKAQSTVANKLRLLRFSEPVRDLLVKNHINERQARALLRLKDEDLDLAINHIIERGLNVAQTERYVDNLLEMNVKPKKKFHPIVKDVRIFLNTISNAISVMNESGINAVSERRDCEDYIEYVVKIPIPQKKTVTAPEQKTNKENISVSIPLPL